MAISRDERYIPRTYWENRLSGDFSLRGVGHLSFTEAYNRWLYRRKRDVLGSLLAGMDIQGKSVLDIGCGTGFFVDWYSTAGAQVTGLDITEVSVRNLQRKYPGSTFRTQDITATDYEPDQSFDIVNMWDVVYHIVSGAAFEIALTNVSKSLKPGGLFILTDWFGAPADLREANHVQARTLNTYKPLMAERGMKLASHLPLYSALNRVHLPGYDNRLGWFYYFRDSFQREPARHNLSVTSWRKLG